MGLLDDIRNETKTRGVQMVLDQIPDEQDRKDLLLALGDRSVSISAIVRVLRARGIEGITADRLYNYRRNLIA